MWAIPTGWGPTRKPPPPTAGDRALGPRIPAAPVPATEAAGVPSAATSMPSVSPCLSARARPTPRATTSRMSSPWPPATATKPPTISPC